MSEYYKNKEDLPYEELVQIENYERKYGPLTLDSEYTKKSPWAWDTKNFPWEVRD